MFILISLMLILENFVFLCKIEVNTINIYVLDSNLIHKPCSWFDCKSFRSDA